jgi:pimeloyl-ACP methyl ester carboxylesterase
MGAFSVDWALVQPRVAQFARVCSYDRAGSGWSDLGPDPRTKRQIVWELHQLLEKSGERAPFVLVGHSHGGLLVRLYTAAYPAEVAGLVLVDAQLDDYVRLTRDGEVMASTLATGRAIPAVKTTGPLRESDVPAGAIQQIRSMASGNASRANEPPRDKLPIEAQRMRAWATAQVKHSLATNNPFDGDEIVEILADRRKQQYPFGNLPLVVLTRGLAEMDGPNAPRFDEMRRKNQAELATRSRVGKQIVVEGGGHHIDLERPELVADAIRDVLSAATRR